MFSFPCDASTAAATSVVSAGTGTPIVSSATATGTATYPTPPAIPTRLTGAPSATYAATGRSADRPIRPRAP